MIIKTESTEFLINVADTPFMDWWLAYIDNITWPNFNCTRWFYYLPENSSKVSAYLDLLEDALLYCSTHITNYDWSNSLQALENYKKEPSQLHLNILHRDFTSQILQKKRPILGRSSQNQFPNEKWLDKETFTADFFGYSENKFEYFI